MLEESKVAKGTSTKLELFSPLPDHLGTLPLGFGRQSRKMLSENKTTVSEALAPVNYLLVFLYITAGASCKSVALGSTPTLIGIIWVFFFF